MFFSHISKEDISRKILIQKLTAILIIFFGVFFNKHLTKSNFVYYTNSKIWKEEIIMKNEASF